jgi:hypothetical protein
MLKMTKNKWQEYKEKNGATLFDALNKNSIKASEETKEKRFSICLSCPELIKLTNQCKKCGCFMSIKTGLEIAKCPINKW